jgi:hypothetical protein
VTSRGYQYTQIEYIWVADDASTGFIGVVKSSQILEAGDLRRAAIHPYSQ